MKYFYVLFFCTQQKIFAAISNVVRNLKPLKFMVSTVGKIPHSVRNDKKATNILCIDFLSCTKVLILLFLATFNTYAETANERWVEQKAKTKDFHFSLKFLATDVDLTAPVALRVISNKNNKVIQEIPVINVNPEKPTDGDWLGIVDANFDTHPDLSIWAFSGGPGPNSGENFYIYNPKKKKFKFDEKLSSLTSVEINPKNKTVSSTFRASCCDHSSETYRYIADRLTLVESWREYLDNDHTMEITVTGKLRKGKMRYTTKKKSIDPEKL